MTTISFDTDALIQRLKHAGLPEDQAREIVRVVKDAQHESLNSRADLVTKQDLLALENRLLVRVGAMLVATIGLLFGLIATFLTP